MRTRILLIISIFFMMSVQAYAADQKITAGVAANFIVPFNEISSLFEKQTGIKVEPVFSSSGKLYAQITSGAPFDIFLSADEERPGKLYKEGLAEKPAVYAKGQVVLWSADRKICSAKNWVSAVRSGEIKKIALANPETAPYGASAMEALKAAGVADELKDRLVYPQDIGQAFQYASTGAVDAGFCALSSALSEEGKKGCWLPMDQAPQVVQSMCIIKKAPGKKAAQRFAEFLLSPEAIKIKDRYGYK